MFKYVGNPDLRREGNSGNPMEGPLRAIFPCLTNTNTQHNVV